MCNNSKLIGIIFYFTVFYHLKTPDYSEAWVILNLFNLT